MLKEILCDTIHARPPTTHYSRILVGLFVAAFLCILSLPLGLKLLSLAPAPVAIVENRVLTPNPDLLVHPLWKWPKLLDAYFKDQLAFRGHVLRSYIRIWEGYLEAPVKRYATGKSGEFFMHYIGPTLLPALGVTPLSREHLVNLKLSYAGIQGYFRFHGIHYLLVTIPDKPTLYPELLPFWTHWKRENGYLSQIVATLHSTPVNVLHLQQYLENEKNTFRLYNMRYDVEHWNGNALKVAYEVIGQRLALVYKQFNPTVEGVYYQRYPRSINWPGYEEEIVPFIEHLQQETLQNNSKTLTGWSATNITINQKEHANLTLWLATDSYFMGTHGWGPSINPFAHHVKKYLHMHWGNLDIVTAEKLFLEHKPDIVVEAFVERATGHAGRASDPRIRIMGVALLQTPGHILSASLMPAGITTINAEMYPDRTGQDRTGQIITHLS